MNTEKININNPMKQLGQQKTNHDQNEDSNLSKPSSASTSRVINYKKEQQKSSNKINDEKSFKSDERPDNPNTNKMTKLNVSNPNTKETKFKNTSLSLKEALKSQEDFIDYVISLPATTTEMNSNDNLKYVNDESDQNRNKIIETSGYASIATSGVGGVGLEHLDNLCRIMQQLGDLKLANNRLNKKVLHLKDMKTLQLQHHQIKQSLNAPLTQETASRNMRLSSELLSSKNPNSGLTMSSTSKENVNNKYKMKKEKRLKVYKSKSQVLLSGSNLKRERSKSVGHEELLSNGKSSRKSSSTSKRFPKWSRVKEALGWDKTTQYSPSKTNCNNYKHEINSESDNVKRKISSQEYSTDICDYFYFDISDNEEFDMKNQLINNEFGHISADELLMIQNDDSIIKDNESKNERRLIEFRNTKSQSTDVDLSYRHSPTPLSPPATKFVEHDDGLTKNKNQNKGPWTRVKTMIQTRKDSIKKKTRKSISELSTNKSINETKGLEANRQGKSVSVEVFVPKELGHQQIATTKSSFREAKSLTDISNKSSCKIRKHNIEASLSDVEGKITSFKKINTSSSNYLCVNDIKTNSQCELSSTERGVKNEQDNQNQRKNLSKSKTLMIPFPSPSDNDNVKPQRRHFIQSKSRTITDTNNRSPSRSPPVQRKSRWNKMKKVFANVEAKSSDNIHGQLLSSKSVPASPTSISGMSFNYDEDISPSPSCDDKLESIEKMKKEQNNKKFDLNNLSSSPVDSLVLELQRNLSDEFSKKMKEWERIRSGEPIGSGEQQQREPKMERKSSLPKFSKKLRKSERSIELKTPSPSRRKIKIQDSNWLDKELQIIERERQRLANEKQKYEDRMTRLQKLKDSMINSSHNESEKKEICIRTAAGEFRFEGISDDFTKKLYEWETIRGVGPELSTIELLENSNAKKSEFQNDHFDDVVTEESKSIKDKRMSLQRGMSKSETSIIIETSGNCNSNHQTSSSNSLPSLIQKDNNLNIISIEELNSSSTLPKSKTESELLSITPPLLDEILIKSKSDEINSDKIDMSIAVRESECQVEIPSMKKDEKEIKSRLKKKFHESGAGAGVGASVTASQEDNYYNLLEENMYLLEQLKTKEEICRRLESELGTLDERMGEMNSAHKKEMEKFREKLWEVHMVGAKPRDLERSLKLITDLKNKIEKLQHCSERLKSDKETLEDSFRYHSQQQAKLTVDLIEKMKELQYISISSPTKDEHKEGNRRNRRRKGYVRCDHENISKLHDLSTLLLQQARELEHSLIEKTRQICRLRWELLNRDVSAMRLQTELHQAKVQQGQTTRTTTKAADKRYWYKQRRSWSSSEALCLKIIEKEDNNEESIQNRYNKLSTMIYSDWPKLDCHINELSGTVQQLKMEILKLTYLIEQQSNSDEANSGGESQNENPSAIKYNGILSSPLYAELLHDYESLYGRSNESSTNQDRRNSVDNISSMSGQGSETSSSLNEGDRVSYVLRLPKKKLWRRSRDNMSTSSEDSFIEEESFTAVQWCRPRTSSDFGSERDGSCADDSFNNSRELVLYSNGRNIESKFNRFNIREYACRNSTSRSSSEVTDQRTDSWTDIYKQKGQLHYGQFSETSSSAFNEGLEESSSASGHRFPSIGTPESTPSNFRSSSSSHPSYAAIALDNDESPTWKAKIEQEVIPEGCALPASERRHSDPDRRFRFNTRAIKAIEARDRDSDASTSVFTVFLPRKCSMDLTHTDLCSKPIQEEVNSDNVSDSSKHNDELGQKHKHSHSITSETSKAINEKVKSEKSFDSIQSGDKLSDENSKKIESNVNKSKEAVCSYSLSSLVSSNSDAMSQKRMSGTSHNSLAQSQCDSNKSSSSLMQSTSSLSSKVSSHFAKYKKSKDNHKEMSTIATLCKQSLMVKIDDENSNDSNSNPTQDNNEQSDDTTKSKKNANWFNVFKK